MGKVRIIEDAGTRNRKVRVHYDGGLNSTTLCGLALEGGVDLNEISAAEPTTRRVNCENCLTIVRYCQHLPRE